jgi:Carboxypeptidase regulatory-like domain/TonB dependent receptor/TonB-dependent Receptor Plug Domain
MNTSPARSFLAFSLLSLVPLSPIAAGSIRGTVTSAQSGKTIGGVTVTIARMNRAAVTDSSGGFLFDSVAPGSYNLEFTKPAFESRTVNDIYVSGDAEKRLEVELAPGAKELDKMIVVGAMYHKPPDMVSSTKEITSDELLRAPGALMDVQRVVQNLPSVSSGGDNTNEIIVRGGLPGENLFLLDNIEIPNPNQFAEQGTGGGVISLINPLLVKGITFNAGAPPAQYGGKAASVLDVKLRDGNGRMVLGGVDVGVAGAGFHLEGPVAPQTNFMLSATKSYLDFVAHSSLNHEAVAVPEYWGMQARVARTTATTRIYADAVYGDNSITIDSADVQLGTRGSTLKSGGYVYATGMTWEQFVTDRLTTSVTVSGTGNTFDRLEYSEKAGPDTFFKNTSLEEEQTVKAQASFDFADNDKLIVGGMARRADFNINIWEVPDTLIRYAGPGDSVGAVVRDSANNPFVWQQSVQGRGVAYKYAAFVSSILWPNERMKVVPGVRVDGFTYNKSLTFSPRLGASWTVSPGLEATGALGVQYQDPDYADLVKSALNRTLPPKRVVSAAGGLEYLFKEAGVKTVVEGYYKKIDDAPVDSSLLRSDAAYASAPQDRFITSNVLLPLGKGQSYGLELFAEKKLTKEVSWSAAYSLSKSEMRDPRPGHEGQWYRGDYDFGNALTLTGGWKKELLPYAWYRSLHNRLWFKILSPIMPVADRNEISAKWRYLGPRPHPSLSYDSTAYHRWYVDNSAPINADVYGASAYHKLDIRWERRFGFGFLQMMYYFDLQNVYGRKNIWTYVYTDGRFPPTPVYQLMFFPAGGIIIGF